MAEEGNKIIERKSEMRHSSEITTDPVRFVSPFALSNSRNKSFRGGFNWLN